MQAERIDLKTTRTGLDAERPALRQRYAEARTNGDDHAEARAAVAKGLPLHLVEEWTSDLCGTFDGTDSEAQKSALVSTVLQNGGKIVRTFYADQDRGSVR